MDNGVIKITQQINNIGDFESFTIMGVSEKGKKNLSVISTEEKNLYFKPSRSSRFLGLASK